MNKSILIGFLFSFMLGNAQEKKISFTKEIDYQLNTKHQSSFAVKLYSGNNDEFLIKASINGFPIYFFTDTLGTSYVNLGMNNHLESSDVFSSMYGLYDDYGDNNEEILESKKLGTEETILGIPCSQYLISSTKDGQDDINALKVCVNEKSPYNNISAATGIMNLVAGKSKKVKISGLKGLILKVGPKESYDEESFVATSMKDSDAFVYFDHKKAMVDQQRKQDSIMLAYKKEQDDQDDFYSKLPDSSNAAGTDIPPPPVASDNDNSDEPYSSDSDDNDNYYIPDYISEYKKDQNQNKDIEAGNNLAINNIQNKNLWKGIPGHCRNFEGNIPEFDDKDLKNHLKNYVGQVCDMYLTQSYNHNVAVKATLDEIRSEVLYFNKIQNKLNKSDKKKLTKYLESLD